ncbi:MAG: Nif3-like dinuclear metal center hexameric protein [bacterium]
MVEAGGGAVPPAASLVRAGTGPHRAAAQGPGGPGAATLVTGEGPHWTYALAEDAGINAFYGGHYATETFGVRALAQVLSDRFRIPWTFIDHPTGL